MKSVCEIRSLAESHSSLSIHRNIVSSRRSKLPLRSQSGLSRFRAIPSGRYGECAFERPVITLYPSFVALGPQGVGTTREDKPGGRTNWRVSSRVGQNVPFGMFPEFVKTL